MIHLLTQPPRLQNKLYYVVVYVLSRYAAMRLSS
jgi:hypothetical protein